jgi:hypothetical protein
VLEALKNCEGNFHSDLPLESTLTKRPGGFDWLPAGCVRKGKFVRVSGAICHCRRRFMTLMQRVAWFYLHYVTHNNNNNNNKVMVTRFSAENADLINFIIYVYETLSLVYILGTK